MEWKQLLSPKRVKALWGEESSSKQEGDPRTEFERDYGRTTFSTPVRRLQDKAQVFPLEEHDAVRTRLTHSLEVSSVSRSLGQAIGKIATEKSGITEEERSSISTIAATCGLIHDLGNPPFGHAGEQAIGDWFRKKADHDDCLFASFSSAKGDGRDTQFAKDFLNFEGNAQTQRLLSRLQVLADDFGLNLTCGTLSASCKYVATSDTIDKSNQAKKKHGFFASENDLIRRIREQVGTGDARNPITFIVEASDDIVYSTVDLEDGIKKGCLTWEFLELELKKRCDSGLLRRALAKAHQKIDVANLAGPALQEAMAVAFRTFAISEMVVATILEFEKQYQAIMEGIYPSELLYESEAGALAKTCKEIGFSHVYSSHEILKREIMGRGIIFDLMDLYWEAAQEAYPGKEPKGFAGKVYRQISSNYRGIFEENLSKSPDLKIPEQYFRMQLITDQISGMTDSFAAKLHRELTNG